MCQLGKLHHCVDLITRTYLLNYLAYGMTLRLISDIIKTDSLHE